MCPGFYYVICQGHSGKLCGVEYVQHFYFISRCHKLSHSSRSMQLREKINAISNRTGRPQKPPSLIQSSHTAAHIYNIDLQEFKYRLLFFFFCSTSHWVPAFITFSFCARGVYSSTCQSEARDELIFDICTLLDDLLRRSAFLSLCPAGRVSGAGRGSVSFSQRPDIACGRMFNKLLRICFQLTLRNQCLSANTC